MDQEDCVNGEHLWIYVGSSSEACYVGENECLVSCKGGLRIFFFKNQRIFAYLKQRARVPACN